MKLKQFYEVLGGNYEKVLERFLGQKTMLYKYLMKFAADQSFVLLEEAVNEKDVKKVYYAAHTLRGVCANFDMFKLIAASNELMNATRKGDAGSIDYLFPDVKKEYDIILDAIAHVDIS